MFSTGTALRTAQQVVNYFGLTDLDRNTFFADKQGRLDPIAAVFRAVTGKTPNCFLFQHGEMDQALLLIRTNETVMEALAWISAALPTPCPTDPETGADDPIEHIAGWFTSVDFYLGRHPGASDVIGVLQRAADLADRLDQPPAARTAEVPERRFGFTDAYGVCLTCGGHGTITTASEEIPFEELSPRRQQGHAAGHRFERAITAPCARCDGRDVITDFAVSAHEASL